MPKKTPFRSFAIFFFIPALLLAGYVSQSFTSGKASSQTKARSEKLAEAMPVELPNDTGETPTEALTRIRDKHLVINVHEHVEDIRQAPTLVEAMDQFGMHETVLMGSSKFTITLAERVGFTHYDENNEELMKYVEQYPDRFVAFPTIDPKDPEKLEKIRKLVERGAKGVKLYLGHGYTRRDNGEYMFHTMAMDDPEMFPLYEFCQANYVPLCFHMQPYKPGFAQEFIEVAHSFPDLKINVPHFMLSTIRESRLRELLDTFPNVYSDISFGHDDFLTAGLRRITKDPEKFRRLFRDYPDRFMFGTDLVMTAHDSKTVPWFEARAQAYYDMLTKKEYTVSFMPGETLRGLELTSPLLDNILYRNFEHFEAMKPKGTKITHEIDWKQMGVEKLDRKPGEAFPPPPPARKRN